MKESKNSNTKENAERTAYAKQLINKINYMTVATADTSGQPWNSPVFCAYDGANTFYWGSRLNAQHSQNITQNNRGFIVIYDSTITPGHGEAFYAQVTYEALADTPELDKAISLLHKRFGEPYMTRDEVLGPERRLYKATVNTAWVKDLVVDVRKEVQLQQ